MQDMSVHDCMTLHLKMKLCLQFRAVMEHSRSFTVPREGPFSILQAPYYQLALLESIKTHCKIKHSNTVK